MDKWVKLDKEAKELRRRLADWEFIRSQPPRIRAALEYLVEDDDLYVASRIAGIKIEEMNMLRKKANIPRVI
ncbi:MAG: hypothetical protein DRN99_07370 [Thermoproteota archaeon]|nr:MAG: hypothetical protein DRN99_07370 [Candidatus Korarchaeota archaeon]